MAESSSTTLLQSSSEEENYVSTDFNSYLFCGSPRSTNINSDDSIEKIETIHAIVSQTVIQPKEGPSTSGLSKLNSDERSTRTSVSDIAQSIPC